MRAVSEKGRRHDVQTVDVKERKARRPILVLAAMLGVLLQESAIAGDDGGQTSSSGFHRDLGLGLVAHASKFKEGTPSAS